MEAVEAVHWIYILAVLGICEYQQFMVESASPGTVFIRKEDGGVEGAIISPDKARKGVIYPLKTGIYAQVGISERTFTR